MISLIIVCPFSISKAAEPEPDEVIYDDEIAFYSAETSTATRVVYVTGGTDRNAINIGQSYSFPNVSGRCGYSFYANVSLVAGSQVNFDFSATFPAPVDQFLAWYQKNGVWVSVDCTAQTLSQGFSIVVDLPEDADAISVRATASTSGTITFNALVRYCTYTITDVQTSTSKGILAKVKDILQGIIELPSKIANSLSGFFQNIVNALLSLGSFIVDGIKGLFLPSDGFFSSVFDDMQVFFSDRFGFLWYPFDKVLDFCNLFVSGGTSDGNIPFPEVSWEGHTIISAQDVPLLSDARFKAIQDKLYLVGNIAMVGALLALLHRKINEVMKT